MPGIAEFPLNRNRLGETNTNYFEIIVATARKLSAQNNNALKSKDK